MRKLLIVFFLFLIVAISLLLTSSDSSAQSLPDLNGDSERLIVKFRPLVPKTFKEDLIDSFMIIVLLMLLVTQVIE